MKRIGLSLMLALASIAGTACAAAPATQGNTDKGTILMDADGKALYTYDEDMTGMSMCTAQCEKNWPAFVPAPDAKAEGAWSIIKRDDGRQQWAYKGNPLYTWKNDAKPGDTTGDGKGGVWHLAKP